jgi:hypothetical protein
VWLLAVPLRLVRPIDGCVHERRVHSSCVNGSDCLVSAARLDCCLLCACVRTYVVWCGVAWRGVAWCGVVWCGVVSCGVVWRGVVCMAWLLACALSWLAV